MRWSQGLIPTFKEDPSEAEIPSHRLMLRAGLVSKLAAGMYTLLPLGLRAAQHVERIVREEMNRAGGQQLLMPILSPRELWEESGRWEVYGDELMRVKDRHGRMFALGPTHEEVVTDVARRYVKSYRQLPLTLYQIQTKFRDEIRPRFGVMRAREFMMKDAYSFHASQESLDETYRAMHLAYRRIFARCGLRSAAVEADSGAIGGDLCHEMVVFAGTGESEVLNCECGYAASVERAVTRLPPPPEEPERPRERVATPGLTSVEQVSGFLGVPPSRLVKTLLYRDAQGAPVAALIRGDREICEAKIARALGGAAHLATPEEIARVTGGPVGFSGPVGLDAAAVVADHTVAGLRNMVAGANEPDAHFVNVNAPRDFRAGREADLLLARAGDPCPQCGRPLASYRGIEVGHIFQLGQKYSRSLQASYLDEKGGQNPFVMGCYGIGVTRTVAAAIEQHYDADGVIWPASIAPLAAEVLPVNVAHPATMETAESIYRELAGAGVETLLDDREERAGNKFKDADLIGLPFRLTVGEKGLAEGVVEIRRRRGGEVQKVPVVEAAAKLRGLLASELAGIEAAAPVA